MGANMIDRDTSLSKRSGQRSRRIFAVVLGALVLIAVLVSLFQLFMRYEYVIDDHGVVWRIDRLTQETCRVIHSVVRCGPLSPSKSTRLSPSIRRRTRPFIVVVGRASQRANGGQADQSRRLRCRDDGTHRW